MSSPARSSSGTRIRAGNAMDRTRAALLDGARRAVEQSGTKVTMGQVAELAGVAKATLYNHFRTKTSVLHALLLDEVGRLIEASSGRSLPEALERAAESVASHPLLRTLSELEPATVAALARVGTSAEAWQRVRDAVEEALGADGRAGTDFVLRWLASYLVSPASDAQIAADRDVLVAGLPSR